MSSDAHFLLMWTFFLSTATACVDRARGEEEDEIERLCAKACPLQFECGFALEGNTLAKCLATCPEHTKELRDECEAHFELSSCIGSLTCNEYFEYADAIEHPGGRLGEHPGFPCQDEVVAKARECYGAEFP